MPESEKADYMPADLFFSIKHTLADKTAQTAQEHREALKKQKAELTFKGYIKAAIGFGLGMALTYGCMSNNAEQSKTRQSTDQHVMK